MGIKLDENQPLLPVNGVSLSACSAGLYKKPRPDLALVLLEENCNVVAVFTKNEFCAAPVIVAKNHLLHSSPSILLINAGNANAGTGKQGYVDAIKTCECVAQQYNLPAESVLPFSTGVIGMALPVEKICRHVPELISSLSDKNWGRVSEAILTTDTTPKCISRQVMIDNVMVTITGIAKGSGMIKPDMATMLAFIATDAEIEKNLLTLILNNVVNQSFNRISIDGDTSTNDACVLIATGKSGKSPGNSIDDKNVCTFIDKLMEVCIYLATSIVRDGEGVTKFVTLDICGGANEEECRKVAETIAHSPLVKTALFASDPNWGRILAAIGRSGIRDIDINNLEIDVNDLCIVKNGELSMDYTEEAGQKVFSADEIIIKINLNRGNEKFRFWTCDLSYEYVRINAEYRT